MGNSGRPDGSCQEPGELAVRAVSRRDFVGVEPHHSLLRALPDPR